RRPAANARRPPSRRPCPEGLGARVRLCALRVVRALPSNSGAPRFRSRSGDRMGFTVTGLLLYLLIAGICGALGRAVAGGGTSGGFLASIAVGFIGAMLGSWVASALHLPEPWMVVVERHSIPILWSIIGASLFVALIHLIQGRPTREL